MTLPLPLSTPDERWPPISAAGPAGRAAIEEDGFPFEDFCDIAELESWRKEINRPLYHIHKWWAQRLGSVFRAIVIGALAPVGTDVKRSFYRPVRFPGVVVFDPSLMGSGRRHGRRSRKPSRLIAGESWARSADHIHKWWAQRLGSVFRAIVSLGAVGTDVKRSFYRPVRFPGVVVFDPFMGSGTTLGEALKLGCRAVAETSILAFRGQERVRTPFPGRGSP